MLHLELGFMEEEKNGKLMFDIYLFIHVKMYVENELGSDHKIALL